MKAVELEDIVRKSLECRMSTIQSINQNSAPGKTIVLAAVSGGVDSMVMLTVLKKLSEPLCLELHAITVNHNIRPKEESAGDAALVEEYCGRLCVPCTVTELKRNEVAETALARGGGTEEAARFLRYQAFERTAEDCGADLVCIAHNRNDRLETLVGRFFQGAAGSSAAGMKQYRDRYFRPLFDVTRAQIEAYAESNGIPFRTDATNADNSYYRNRIRNELMPLLDSLIPGWDTAVIHGAEKSALIAAALEKHAACAEWSESEDCAGKSTLSMSVQAFEALECAERIEALYRALYRLGTEKRVPFEMLRAVAEDGRKAEGAGILIKRERGKITVSRQTENERDGFYCLINRPGRYQMPWGEIIIRECKERVGKNAFLAENIKNGAISGKFMLPAAVRSRQPADRIRDAAGGHKEVSKLFSEWHIPENLQSLLPVFDNGEVTGVWGAVFGYPDYFVTSLEDISAV